MVNSIDHLLSGEPLIQQEKEDSKRPTRTPSPPKGKPAFATHGKGGIFGFKK